MLVNKNVNLLIELEKVENQIQIETDFDGFTRGIYRNQ